MNLEPFNSPKTVNVKSPINVKIGIHQVLKYVFIIEVILFLQIVPNGLAKLRFNAV